MNTPGWACGIPPEQHKLFEACNAIASLRYEGTAGIGRMILARQKHPHVHSEITLHKPMPLSDYGWARKLLEVSSGEFGLLADPRQIYGLGTVDAGYDEAREDLFVVDFTGHHEWELTHAGRLLMRVDYGSPQLPRERLR